MCRDGLQSSPKISMPMTSPHMRMLGFRHRYRPVRLQLLQDRTLRPLRIAAPPQLHQLFLQRHQAIDPSLHMLDMFVDQRIDAAARIIGAVAQA